MIFSAQLNEFGSYYTVVNVILNEVKFINPNSKYVSLDSNIAMNLKNELNQGKHITIRKEFVDRPTKSTIPLDMFKIKEPDTLEMRKNAVKAKMNSRVSAFTSMLSALDMYAFFVTFVKLTSLGYPIFDDTKKEETFLQIIETEDEELIQDLEKFLELKDRFDKIYKKYSGYRQFCVEIDNCESMEEIDEVLSEWKGWAVS